MRLELGEVFIKDVVFGKKTTIIDGKLATGKEKLTQRLKEDKRIKDVKIMI